MHPVAGNRALMDVYLNSVQREKEEAIRLLTIQIVIKAKRMMCIVQSTLMSGLL